MNQLKLCTASSASALALLVTGHAAAAQPAKAGAPAQGAQAAPAIPGEGTLTEIVVTARRVQENLQSVPVAVTAFTSEALVQQNAKNVSDIGHLTPGLTFAPAQTASSAVVISMRGQVQNDPIATLDPSVGTYVDGVYWARAYGLNASLLDVSSVQTLRGPQGTLFGRNTTGGAILLETNDPTFGDHLSGALTGTYGNYNYFDGSAVLNAPLINDVLAVRLAFQTDRRDGYVREVNTNTKLGDLNDTTFRAKVLVQPTSDLRLVLSGESFHSKGYSNPERLQYFSPTGPSVLEAGVETLGASCFGAAGPTPACLAAGAARLSNDVAIGRNPKTASLSILPYSEVRTTTYSGTGTYDTSFGSIKAIGAYRHVRNFATADNDGSSVRTLDGIVNDVANLTQWSGEVIATGRALDNKLDFATGLFWFRESGTDRDRAVTFPALTALSTGGLDLFTIHDGKIKNTSEGIYGQATYHLTDRLSLTGGLRYSYDNKILYLANRFELGPLTICEVGATCPRKFEKSFTGVSYTASLDYKLTDDALVYLKTARGFRSGGQNIRGSDVFPSSLEPFDPEIATTYEAGLKSELLDRRLRLNLAAYYTDVKGIQESTTLVSPTGSTATAIGNAGKSRFYGFEAEANAVLPAGFRLDGTLAYINSKYLDFKDPATGFDRSHEPFPLVPKWAASISPSWHREFSFGGVGVRGDFSYQSAMAVYPTGFYRDAGGLIHDATTGQVVSAADAQGFNTAATDRAHWLVNGRANVTLQDGKLDFAVWVRNLTDKRDNVAGLPLVGLGGASAIIREPRTFGATVSVKY